MNLETGVIYKVNYGATVILLFVKNLLILNSQEAKTVNYLRGERIK